MDGQTGTPSHTDAWTHLKTRKIITYLYFFFPHTTFTILTGYRCDIELVLRAFLSIFDPKRTHFFFIRTWSMKSEPGYKKMKKISILIFSSASPKNSFSFSIERIYLFLIFLQPGSDIIEKVLKNKRVVKEIRMTYLLRRSL